MPTLNTVTLGKFCREIACGLSPIEDLIDEWGLTPEDYDQIRESEGFKAEMQLVVREMQELGPDAGYVYRMKSLAEDQIAEVVKIMSSQDTTTSQKIELIRFVAEMSRLKEKPAPKGADFDGAPRGPHVVFHFGAGLPIKSMELTPEPPAKVIDMPVRGGGFDLVPE